VGADDTLYRLASAKFSGMLVDPESYRLPRYAGQRVRMVEAIVELRDRVPCGIARLIYEVLRFDEHGRLDSNTFMRQNFALADLIPVCVGIADTKTLAKLANHCAKKGFAGKRGVCDFGLGTKEQLSKLFARIPVGDVWGVGRKITEKLQAMGINSVEDLRTANPERIRSQFSVVLGRTVSELNGVPCIELDDAGTPRSRSWYHARLVHL